MVERAPAPDDRRIQMVSLTSRGKENFANMAENQSLDPGMMEQLTANELNSLYDLLARLKELYSPPNRKITGGSRVKIISGGDLNPRHFAWGVVERVATITINRPQKPTYFRLLC